MACAAKASFDSMMSIESSPMPAFSIAIFVAGIGPSPMMWFGTPATAYDTSRASGFVFASRAASASASTRNAAPSLIPDALPAVTVPPSFLNAGRIEPSFSQWYLA
jgi:hypothetical protein